MFASFYGNDRTEGVEAVHGCENSIKPAKGLRYQCRQTITTPWALKMGWEYLPCCVDEADVSGQSAKLHGLTLQQPTKAFELQA